MIDQQAVRNTLMSAMSLLVKLVDERDEWRNAARARAEGAAALVRLRERERDEARAETDRP